MTGKWFTLFLLTSSIALAGEVLPTPSTVNIEQSGVLKGTRGTVNISGATVTDDPTNDRVNIAITGGGGGGGAVSSVNTQVGDVVLGTDDIAEGVSNLYWTLGRFDLAFAGKSTDGLTEGTTNLYWTLGRFNLAFASKSTSDLSEGSNLYWTPTRFDTAFSGKSTSNLTEGSNLYWTPTRFDTAFSGKSTSNLSEGSNLYWTSGRFDTALGTKTTDNLTEGSTNQYFTPTRAKSAAVSDTAYDATTWDGVTDTAPSKNAVRDQMETKLTNNASATLSNTKLAETTKYVNATDPTKVLKFDLSHQSTGVATTFQPGSCVSCTTDALYALPAIPSGKTGVTLVSAEGTTFSKVIMSDWVDFTEQATLFPGIPKNTLGIRLLDNGDQFSYINFDTKIIHVNGVVRVELDFGSTPLTEKSFTITDSNFLLDNGETGMENAVEARVARTVSTGKTYYDETDMDSFFVSCTPGSGNLTCVVRCLTGQFRGTLMLDYKQAPQVFVNQN